MFPIFHSLWLCKRMKILDDTLVSTTFKRQFFWSFHKPKNQLTVARVWWLRPFVLTRSRYSSIIHLRHQKTSVALLLRGTYSHTGKFWFLSYFRTFRSVRSNYKALFCHLSTGPLNFRITEPEQTWHELDIWPTKTTTGKRSDLKYRNCDANINLSRFLT